MKVLPAELQHVSAAAAAVGVELQQQTEAKIDEHP